MGGAVEVVAPPSSGPGQSTAWWAVAHVDELAEAGNFLSREVGGTALIAVRDGADSVHVLANTCPHQGLPICTSPGRGKIRSFQCPFHGWSFAIDGRYLPPVLPRLPAALLAGRPVVATASRSLTAYQSRSVDGIVFAALPDRRGPADAAPGVGPALLTTSPGPRHPDTADVSQLRTDRFWQPVYEELLTTFESEAVEPVAVNAFAVRREPDVYIMCAVIPRSPSACTVTVVREGVR